VKTGRQKGGQDLSQGVNDTMRRVLRARTELKHRKNLGEGINGQPEPQDLLGVAQPGAEFVQLEVRKLEVAEAVLVQGLCMFPCASEPGGDGGLTVTEDPFGRGSIQPFGQRRQNHSDLMRGSFQTVQWRVASSTERGSAGLTAKGLDALGTAMLTIANQCVDLGIGDPAVGALRVGTGVALSIHPLGCSPPAFHLAPRSHWSRRWPATQRGSGGETTGGAIVWAAGLQETGERATLDLSS
jgi:hypothetical protein